MKTDALRGITYPEATDPILSGFETLVRTTGSIRAVDSVAIQQLRKGSTKCH